MIPLKFFFEDTPLRVGVKPWTKTSLGAGSMTVLIERADGV